MLLVRSVADVAVVVMSVMSMVEKGLKLLMKAACGLVALVKARVWPGPSKVRPLIPSAPEAPSTSVPPSIRVLPV